MKYTTVISKDLASIITDYLILPMYEKDDQSMIISLDKALGGQINSLNKQGDFTGKHNSVLPLLNLNGVKAARILLVGLGAKKEFNHTKYKAAIATAMKAISQENIKQISFFAPECADTTISFSSLINSSIEMIGHAVYRFTEFKSTKPKPNSITEISFLVHKDTHAEALIAVKQGAALTLGMNLTKDLGNCAPNIMNPENLAKAAEILAKDHPKIKCEILDRGQMKKLGMGSLLAVAQGSEQKPKLIVLEFMNGKSKDKPIVLVGKGVTFDSGGISLKPGEGMDEMKYDMCGAASVLGVFKAIATMDLKANVVAIIPAVENMPSGSAARPGDIVTSMSGQTIEILNTDAEGRLILCDALTYAEKYSPKAVVDIATLTGAIIVALGNTCSGLFSNDQSLADILISCGQKTDDKVWQLPIFDDYQPLLDSNFADMANIGGRAGGSITAACFLSRFAKKYPWAHLDIAGTAWKSGKEKGATARPVSLLVEFITRYA
ncbi:multifunctional aminopeptidase A [Gammaproteobacteria bacterium]|nr:multifunctional aminopeptidase A [Gammaproteobacteria bacterium]